MSEIEPRPYLEREDPQKYGAAPVLGNYTESPQIHLLCAEALAVLLSTDEPPSSLDDGYRDALQELLKCEVRRGRYAMDGESRARADAEGRA